MQKSSVVNLFAAGFLTLLYGIFLLDTRWGLGFPILNTLLLGFILWQRPDIRKNKLSLTFIVLSLLLSSFLALRSFIPGQIITLLTIFILNSLLVTKGETNNPLTFKTLFLSPLYIIWNTLRQPIKQINNLISVFGKDNQTLKVIIKGSLIGIPIACLFIWLFVMADPLFEKHYLNLVNSFKFDFWLIKKVIELYIAAGVILSFIFVTSKSYAEFEFLSKRQHIQKEIAVATVFIAAVIGLFLVVQGEYLFAGEQMLKDMGVMLSEYTRRGYT